MARRGAEPSRTRRRSPSSTSRRARPGSSPASGASTSAARWLPDGSLLFVSDADGWFQVVRLTADGHDRIVLTERRARARRARRRRSGDVPAAVAGRQPLRPHRDPRRPPGPARRRAGRGGSRRSAAADGRRRRHGPSRRPRPATGSTRGTASGGRSAGWPTAPGSRRSASARPRRRTCGCCPSPASRPTTPARARSPTRCRPCSAPRSHPSRVAAGRADHRHGPRRPARRGHPVAPARRDRQARRHARPDDHLPARRPDRRRRSARSSRSSSSSSPRASRCLDVDFRGSTGYGRAFRLANHGEWGHADVHDLIDAARWAAEPAVVGRPAGDLRRLVRRLHGPVRAGRGARACGGRGRPVRRLGDRRELPPRRPAGPPRPAQDDGLARRPGTQRRSTAAARRSTAPSGSRRRC